MRETVLNIQKKQVKTRAFAILVLSVAAFWLYTVAILAPGHGYLFTSIAKVLLFAAAPALYVAFCSARGFVLPKILPNVTALKYTAIFAGAVFALILIAFALFNSILDFDMIRTGINSEDISRATYPFVFIYIIFINAAVEEVFFRGFVFLELYNLGYKRIAYVFSSFFFAAYHIPMMLYKVTPLYIIVAMPLLVVAGLFFNEVCRRSNSVLGSLIVHAAANLAINIIGAYVLYFA